MPWISLIVALIGFLLAKSQGASTAKAAMIGAGAGLATYYVADPANPDNLLELSYGGDKEVTGTVNTDNGSNSSSAGKLLGSAISEVGTTARSWGPAGTLGVIAGTTALSSFDLKKWTPWIIGGVALFLLTR